MHRRIFVFVSLLLLSLFCPDQSLAVDWSQAEENEAIHNSLPESEAKLLQLTQDSSDPSYFLNLYNLFQYDPTGERYMTAEQAKALCSERGGILSDAITNNGRDVVLTDPSTHGVDFWFVEAGTLKFKVGGSKDAEIETDELETHFTLCMNDDPIDFLMFSFRNEAVRIVVEAVAVMSLFMMGYACYVSGWTPWVVLSSAKSKRSPLAKCILMERSFEAVLYFYFIVINLVLFFYAYGDTPVSLLNYKSLADELIGGLCNVCICLIAGTMGFRFFFRKYYLTMAAAGNPRLSILDTKIMLNVSAIWAVYIMFVIVVVGVASIPFAFGDPITQITPILMPYRGLRGIVVGVYLAVMMLSLMVASFSSASLPQVHFDAGEGKGLFQATGLNDNQYWLRPTVFMLINLCFVLVPFFLMNSGSGADPRFVDGIEFLYYSMSGPFWMLLNLRCGKEDNLTIHELGERPGLFQKPMLKTY